MAVDRNAKTLARMARDWQLLPIPVFNVVPTGTIDGSNDTFTLPSKPKTGTLLLFVTGVLMGEGVDYTLAGKIITFAGGSIPALGAWIKATYAE